MGQLLTVHCPIVPQHLIGARRHIDYPAFIPPNYSPCDLSIHASTEQSGTPLLQSFTVTLNVLLMSVALCSTFNYTNGFKDNSLLMIEVIGQAIEQWLHYYGFMNSRAHR